MKETEDLYNKFVQYFDKLKLANDVVTATDKNKITVILIQAKNST